MNPLNHIPLMYFAYVNLTKYSCVKRLLTLSVEVLTVALYSAHIRRVTCSFGTITT